MTYSEGERQETEPVFIRSWDGLEFFFRANAARASGEHLKEMVVLIRLLRERGCDRRLLAGQSMMTFIVSRALKQRTEDPHACMEFRAVAQGGIMVRFLAPNVSVGLTLDHAEITPVLDNLLIALMVYPISID
jgi:hypothetical protein